MASVTADTGGERKAKGERFLGTVIVIALTLALAYQLAHWTWVFFAPGAVATDIEREDPVDLAAVARLFGAEAPDTANSSVAGSLKLKGVVAPTPEGPASAIFSTGSGRDISIFIGNEVQPGVKLVEVMPDHVIVTRGGVRGRIDLEKPRSTLAKSQTPGARTIGFRLNVARTGSGNFALSRKELDDALRDPNQLSYLGQIAVPPGGGVRLESAPSGSLAQKLGLQQGDLIKKVNGQAVASPGDLARLYQQFATMSLIQAEVQRGSSTVQLSYSIQP